MTSPVYNFFSGIVYVKSTAKWNWADQKRDKCIARQTQEKQKKPESISKWVYGHQKNMNKKRTKIGFFSNQKKIQNIVKNIVQNKMEQIKKNKIFYYTIYLHK